MKLLKKLAPSLALLGGLISINTIVPEYSKASTSTAECEDSGTISGSEFVSLYGDGDETAGSVSSDGMCYGTPEKYEVTIYEMGLCETAPITSSASTVAEDATDGFAATDYDTVDTSSCAKTTLSSKSGDLAGGASFSLGAGTRPPAGSYNFAYIILGNTFGLKGSYEFTDAGGTTYYSTGEASGTEGGNVDSTTGTATAVDFTETLLSFGGGSCSTGDHVGREQFTTGSASERGWLTAVVTDSSKNVQTTCGAGAVARIMGQFEPSEAITISEGTSGMKVTFTVTNSGMSVIGDGSGGLNELGSGPFRVKMTIID